MTRVIINEGSSNIARCTIRPSTMDRLIREDSSNRTEFDIAIDYVVNRIYGKGFRFCDGKVCRIGNDKSELVPVTGNLTVFVGDGNAWRER